VSPICFLVDRFGSLGALSSGQASLWTCWLRRRTTCAAARAGTMLVSIHCFHSFPQKQRNNNISLELGHTVVVNGVSYDFHLLPR
jgi:hypothetical protein